MVALPVCKSANAGSEGRAFGDPMFLDVVYLCSEGLVQLFGHGRTTPALATAASTVCTWFPTTKVGGLADQQATSGKL